MNKLSLCLIGLFVYNSMYAQNPSEMKYTPAYDMTIIGKCMETPENPYHRIDMEKYCQKDEKLANKIIRSSGLAVLFKTNSTAISVRWEITPRSVYTNMTPISVGGLDMYIRVKNEWIFAGFVSPEIKDGKIVGNTSGAMMLKNMDNTEKECMMYLPIMAEVRNLEIGTLPGATLEKIENPFRHNIVFIGSSMSQGASAPRPGMGYISQLSRKTGLNFINVGASGECKFQDDLADIICNTHADAYVLDAFSNCSVETIRQRMIPFIQKVRETHPTTPLIFMQTIVRESTNFDRSIADFEKRKREAAVEMYAKAAKQFKNIHFVSPKDFTGADHEGTTDAVHPSGLGQTRMANALIPPLKKILSKYGIK